MKTCYLKKKLDELSYWTTHNLYNSLSIRHMMKPLLILVVLISSDILLLSYGKLPLLIKYPITFCGKTNEKEVHLGTTCEHQLGQGSTWSFPPGYWKLPCPESSSHPLWQVPTLKDGIFILGCNLQTGTSTTHDSYQLRPCTSQQTASGNTWKLGVGLWSMPFLGAFNRTSSQLDIFPLSAEERPRDRPAHVLHRVSSCGRSFHAASSTERLEGWLLLLSRYANQQTSQWMWLA